MHGFELLMMIAPLFIARTGEAQSLDPVVVNATMEHVKLENSNVRVIEGVLQPGDKEQIHSHPAFVTYVVAGAKIRNHFADGSVVEAELATGDVLWREPQTHWVENIDTTTLHLAKHSRTWIAESLLPLSVEGRRDLRDPVLRFHRVANVLDRIES